MSGVNRAIIMGNVGKDPDIRDTRDGGKIANFSVACSEQWRDKRTGEKVQKTEWVRVCCFNPHQVDVIQKYVKKGSVVHVVGELRTRKWTGNDGVERFTTEVVLPQFGGELTLVSSPKDLRTNDGDSRPRQPSGTDQRGNPRYEGGSTGGGDFGDEIPFGPEWR